MMTISARHAPRPRDQANLATQPKGETTVIKAKRLQFLATALTLSTSLGLGASGAYAYQLAGTSGLASDAYWISLMCGGTKAAEAAGSKIDWYAVKNGSDAAEAMANYEALKVAAPDGVVLSQFSTEPPAGYVKELMNKGVPVVYTNGQPAADRSYLIGYQSAPADSKMAEVAAKIIADTGGKGKMAVLGGIAGTGQQLDGRWNILTKILKEKAPGIEILDTQYDQFDANKANDVISATIVGNPDLNVVYTVSGPEGQGAVAAVKAAGKSGKIFVYSFDAVPLLQDALRDGTVKALIAQPPRLEGEQAVKALIKYLDSHKGGGPVAPDAANQSQLIDVMVLTKENMDSPTAAGYLYKDACK
jgi:ribose transport system substrate-binding protein